MRAPLVPMIVLIAHAAGCVSTRNVTLPRYERGGDDAVAAAPTSGVYEVKWSADGKKFRAIRGSQRIVGSEQPIGFESRLDGQVLGVAGRERFELRHVPRRAKYLVWNAEIRDRNVIGHAVAAPVTLASGVYAYWASRPPSPPSAGSDPFAAESPIESVMRLQEEVRCAKEESKRESNKLRRELGLPPRD